MNGGLVDQIATPSFALVDNFGSRYEVGR